METQEAYQCTYWIHREQEIALVRVSDTIVQGWKAQGRKLDEDFEHSHFQTTYPDKARLDLYLESFEPSTVDEFIEIQFAQHGLDDHFRKKASEWKQRQFENKPENHAGI